MTAKGDVPERDRDVLGTVTAFSADSSKENHELHCDRRSTAQIRKWYAVFECNYHSGNALVNKSGKIRAWGTCMFLHLRSIWILHSSVVLILLSADTMNIWEL
jgi:hypothetical protein